MLGYVTIEKSELKVREYDLYQAHYCGICKSVGRRIGQIPRMALSYDSVFSRSRSVRTHGGEGVGAAGALHRSSVKKRPVAAESTR